MDEKITPQDVFNSLSDVTPGTRGISTDKTAFDGKKYDVSQLSYPSDLFGTNNAGVNPYGGNYVVFYINVSVESKLLKVTGADTVADVDPRNRGNLAGENISKTNAITTAAAGSAVIGGAASTLASGAITTLRGALSRASRVSSTRFTSRGAIAGALVSATATAGVGYAMSQEVGEFSRPQKRLKSAIALHIPNNFAVRYGIQWSEDNLALFTGITKLSADTADVFKKGGLGQLTADATAAATAVGLSNFFGGNALSAGFGVATNPKKEQIFTGVEFRTFPMEYNFFPRSAEESQMILDIIQTFRYHMHPEFKDSSNFLYIYPSEFDIVFYNGEHENLSLPRIASCVLFDVQVNYTPNGIFNTFPDGTPTQIQMVLYFRELTVLTKENIADGY